MPSRFTTIADALYTTAVTRFLTCDYGLVPSCQFVTDSPPDDLRPELLRAFQDIVPGVSAPVEFTSDGGRVHDVLRTQEGPPPLVLGSSWDRAIARELGACHLSLAAPMTDRLVCSRAYAGYHGGLQLLEDIYSSILNSVQ
jgi:nitrogenase molybdenum-iron protein beta chain